MDTATAELLSQEPALGRWNAVYRRPDRRLRPFVLRYQAYSGHDSEFRSRHFPSGGVALIIGFDAGFQVTGPDTLADLSEYRTTFVAGLHDTYSDSRWLGRSNGVQVDFTPIGAHLFFGMPMHLLSNRVLELDDAIGVDGRRLVEQLRGTSAWDARFRILEAFVVSRLLGASRDPSPEVVWAWQKLDRSGGRAPIGSIATELGWSQKRLIARFREQVGLPPKTLARVLRFDRAVSALAGVAAPDWTGIALECGYYDQPHLVREFREFAGTTPTEFLALRRPASDVPAA
jgi:AraC-like DNA-binding protein